jgi:hypothetical protein
MPTRRAWRLVSYDKPEERGGVAPADLLAGGLRHRPGVADRIISRMDIGLFSGWTAHADANGTVVDAERRRCDAMRTR